MLFSAGLRHAALFICIWLATAPALDAQIRFLESARTLPRDAALGLLAPSPTRTLIDLNGRWEYRVADDDTWNSVSVPSSFTGASRVIFRREFTVDSRLAARSVFQFVALSIAYACEVRINDQFVGKHAGDATFSLKISQGVIKAGRNVITIDVSNVLNAQETIPLREQLWNPARYGGIVHDIAIAANGAVWVQETSVRTDVGGDGKAATVEYQALLNSGPVTRLGNDSARLPMSFGRTPVDHAIEIEDLQTGEVVFRSDARRVTVESDRLTPVEFSFGIPSVRVWSPETPYVYLLRQRTTAGGILVDESSQIIGFRSVQVDAGGLRLNGAPYFLKGVNWYEDSPRHGRSLSLDELERDVLMIKNLGSNAVRVRGGMAHPLFYALCDRYGLLVLQDLPLYHAPSAILAQSGLHATARNVVREMVMRDQNHPSMIAIGLGQGLDGSDARVQTYIDAVTRAGGHRMPFLHYASFFRLPAELHEALDFAGLDVPVASAGATRAKVEQEVTEIGGKPVFVLSLNHPVEIGNYSGYSDPRSIDAQAQFYLELYPVVRERKFGGVFVNAFSDIAVLNPLMPFDRVQQFTATFGITDAWRQKRLAYDVLKARFNNEKPPVLTIGNYTEDHPATFVVTGILLIIIFAVVYNLFRRFRENVVRSFLRPHNFFTDVRDQRMLSIFQTTMVGVIGSLSAALFQANLMYAWRTNYFVDLFVAQFVVPVWLKQWVNYAAWNPLANIVVTTVLMFVLLVLLSLLLRVLALLVRRTVLMFDAYSATMWSVLPMAMLAPFGMVLYRILGVAVLEVVAVLVWVTFQIWIVSRLLKGAAIVLDLRPLYFYIAGYVVLALVLGSWLWSLDADYGTFAYVRHITTMWSHMQGFAP